MRKYVSWGCLVLLVAVRPLAAEPTPTRLVKETWDAAYLEGAKTGHFHTTVREITEADGRKLLRTTVAMSLTVKRYNAVVQLRMESSTDETPEGKVVGVSLTQFLDKGKAVQTGTVEGNELVVRMPGKREAQRLPWNDKVLGLYRQERLFQDKKVKPGDRLTYLSYEPGLQMVVTVRVAVKEPEEVDLFALKREGKGFKVERARKKLLRVEATPDKVEVGGTAIALPGLTSWLNDDLLPARSQMELPGLGKITLYRTTRAVAEEGGAAPEVLPDLGLSTLIPLNKPLDRPHEARRAVYRITVKGDDEAATALARDARQEVKNVKGDTFELHVRAVREPAAAPERPIKVKDEFLRSSHFLDSDDEKIQEQAREAVGRERDPWRKAQLIEKWVHDHVRSTSTVGFTTASQVARDLEGDCRQHAMLTAALCRAAGVPARTALGLVYVHDRDRGPVFGFHMWTEVMINGGWLALDATLGRGGIGIGHIKITDATWSDAQNLAPLLPVTRVIGKMKIEVLSVD
jgi:hypothetical protein